MDVAPRTKLHEQFVTVFTDPHRRGLPVNDEELSQLATLLNTALPAAYAQFISHHGAVYCPAILRLEIECGLEYPDLRQMFTPREIMKKCRELWTEWLPAGLYAFASDCVGNAFCFRQTTEFQDDAPVIFLSRENEELLTLEPFDDLLRAYLRQANRL